MNNYLFFDTETTDLPKFKLPSDDPTQPKVIQLACILTDVAGEELETFSSLIQIGDTTVNKYAYEAHKITQAKANAEGCYPKEAYDNFHRMSTSASALVCHNFNFDIRLINIMAAQCAKYYNDPDEADLMLSDILELPFHCTMASTTSFCRLPFPSGRKGFKFPKLEELYFLLFDEKFEGAHDALNDVRATKRCFFELKERGVF